MSLQHDLPEKPEFLVQATVVLTVEADNAEDAQRLAELALNASDYWPTVDITEVSPF